MRLDHRNQRTQQQNIDFAWRHGRLWVTEVFGTAGCLTIWCINYTLTVSIRIPTVCRRETTSPVSVCLQKLERELSASCWWLASLFNSCHVTVFKGFTAWTNKAFQRWRSCKKVSQQLCQLSTYYWNRLKVIPLVVCRPVVYWKFTTRGKSMVWPWKIWLDLLFHDKNINFIF